MRPTQLGLIVDTFYNKQVSVEVPIKQLKIIKIQVLNIRCIRTN